MRQLGQLIVAETEDLSVGEPPQLRRQVCERIIGQINLQAGYE